MLYPLGPGEGRSFIALCPGLGVSHYDHEWGLYDRNQGQTYCQCCYIEPNFFYCFHCDDPPQANFIKCLGAFFLKLPLKTIALNS